MKTTPHPSGWIITGLPPDEDGITESDPYATKAEADSDRIGMVRFEAADRRGGHHATKFVHGT